MANDYQDVLSTEDCVLSAFEKQLNEFEVQFEIDQEIDKDTLRDWIKGYLNLSVLKIVFEKKDGSLREMNATLKSSVIPQYEKKTDRSKKENRDVMSVFDLDKQEWRSFRLDSLKRFGVLKDR